MIRTASTQRVLLLADVARFGTMTLAAEALGFSVSAISQQIRKLELEAGQSLVQRHSRGIVLTDAGRAVIEHAEQIQGELKSLQYSLDEIAGLRAGALSMGTFPTVAASLLPLAISRYRHEHPGVQLSVRSARRTGLIKSLNSRDISMALLWDYHWSRVDEANLDLLFLMDDPTDLVVSVSHPLATRVTVTMDELLDELWVVRADNHPMIEVLIRAANHAGFRPRVGYEASDYQEAQGMVAAGLGIALVPRLALTVLRNDVRVIPFAGESSKRRILLARIKGSSTSAAEIAMTSMLVEASRRMSTYKSPHFLRAS